MPDLTERAADQKVLVFLIGALVGAFVARILPPVVAQLAGSMRDPFDDLVADHRRFESLLKQMEESSSDEPLRRTQLLLRLKRRLAAHALAEEDVIYPLLNDEAKVESEAKDLYGEHAEMKIHLYALERLPKTDSRWAERVSKLRALIEHHAHQEETVDFPKLRQVLRERGITRMASDVQREKSLIM